MTHNEDAGRQAEIGLRTLELAYEEVFDNIATCIFVLDVAAEGRFKIVHFNPAEERAVGLSNAQVTGRFIDEVFGEEITKKVTANYRLCLEAGTPIEFDDELNLPGGVRHFHSNLIPMRNADGRIHRIVGACLDTTKQKLAEAQVRQNLDEIAHLNRVAAMGELTGSLAHELNQPLAAILSNAQAASRLLGQESVDVQQVRACLMDIIADDKRAGEVIQRLRALLRRGRSEAAAIDLNDVVADVIRLVRNDALLRQVTITFEPFAGLPPVVGDRVQIYQVVLNLIVNGLEAVAEQPQGNRQVLVHTAASEDGVQLTVEDSGGGISEPDFDRLFKPFFSTKRDGLGMGLSISRSIVHAHGGRIWAENGAGSGAIFRCVLPAAQHAPAASAACSQSQA